MLVLIFRRIALRPFITLPCRDCPIPLRPLAAPGYCRAADRLVDYVKKADDSFAWKLVDTRRRDAGTVYTIDLVSQTWHDIKWDHKLQVFVPKDVKPQATMVLWNQGGTPERRHPACSGCNWPRRSRPRSRSCSASPSSRSSAGKTEDALIAETFVRYLETKDATWPLLFPMVKSVVRAMDALQAFAKKEWKFEVKSFVVTGASQARAGRAG